MIVFLVCGSFYFPGYKKYIHIAPQKLKKIIDSEESH